LAIIVIQYLICFSYVVAPTPIATTRNEDSVNSTKYTTYASQNNPSLVLKKKDSTVQCSQTTTIKSTQLSYYFTVNPSYYISTLPAFPLRIRFLMNVIRFSWRQWKYTGGHSCCQTKVYSKFFQHGGSKATRDHYDGIDARSRSSVTDADNG